MKVAVFYHGPPPEEVTGFPADVPHVVIKCPPSRVFSDEQMRQIVECDALYSTGTYITAQVMDAAKKARICQTAGAGYDKIDVEAATRNGILCCNNAGQNASRVADFCMMAMLVQLRNYVKTVNAMDAGRNWDVAKAEGIKALEVKDKVLGIIGLGSIGYRLALRARAFEMKIIYYNSRKESHQDEAKEVGARLVSKDELCRTADVISVHAPLNAQSRHMLSDREFALMKDGVFIVDTARGDIIEEAALRRALDSGKVAGAAMDVYLEEPIRPGNPLIGAPNLYASPHVAGRGKEGVLRAINAAVDNMRDFLEKGKMPINILNPEARPDLFPKSERKA